MLEEESATITTISTVPSTSMSSTVDLRKDDSLPDVEAVASGEPSPESNKKNSSFPPGGELDKYGFLLQEDDHDDNENGVHEKLPPTAVIQRLLRRTEKWKSMLAAFPRVRPRLLRKRVRKGIPHSQRRPAWTALCGISTKMRQNPGLYQQLVRDTAFGVTTDEHSGESIGHSKSFRSLQETIERDIHRTYPRHYMFCESIVEEASSHDDSEQAQLDSAGVCGATTAELTVMMRDLETTSDHPETNNKRSPQSIVQAKGGQASLRRVLKAYSLHDNDVGYCQGMNFIAAMFLTLMPEEEAFWMLVGTYPITLVWELLVFICLFAVSANIILRKIWTQSS